MTLEETLVPECWKEALEAYRYPVDLRRFAGAQKFQNRLDVDLSADDRVDEIGATDRGAMFRGADLRTTNRIVSVSA